MWAWGDNSPYGYLGVGDKIDYSSPVQIGADTNWEKIYGSKQASAAIKTDGTLWTWGTYKKSNSMTVFTRLIFFKTIPSTWVYI